MEHPIFSASIPNQLVEIPDPPQQLWCRGIEPEWGQYRVLAVVGSRRVSAYGQSVIETLLAGLAGYPIIIVSGLALGADQLAHEVALEHGLLTVSFPGSGLSNEVIAPATNYQLARRILESGGALYSEYDQGQKAAPWTFPRRNRLMAGVAEAVLVVEATAKSGTLITARLATEYNRDVLTVPGSIFRDQAEGPHQLLRAGAYPITSSQDIIEHFALEPLDSRRHQGQTPSDLQATETTVWEALGEPKSREQLARELSLSITTLTITISSLEIKGYVIERGGLLRRG